MSHQTNKLKVACPDFNKSIKKIRTLRMLAIEIGLGVRL